VTMRVLRKRNRRCRKWLPILSLEQDLKMIECVRDEDLDAIQRYYFEARTENRRRVLGELEEWLRRSQHIHARCAL
jgi:hypothetical protein